MKSSYDYRHMQRQLLTFALAALVLMHVTGSAQSSLVPYWAGRLGRDSLVGRQISARGGTLWCRLRGDRVDIAGTCADYLSGTITV